MSIANSDASRHGIASYLSKAFEVTPEKAMELVEKHSDIVDTAIQSRSMNYYPGDRIAEAEELVATDWDPDEEDTNEEE